MTELETFEHLKRQYKEHGKLYLKTRWAKLNLGHLMKDNKHSGKENKLRLLKSVVNLMTFVLRNHSRRVCNTSNAFIKRQLSTMENSGPLRVALQTRFRYKVKY